MLDDLRHVRSVAATHLPRKPLRQIDEPTEHPVLPENTDSRAKGRDIWSHHAEGTVDGPEDEEQDEEVVGVPESFVVGATRLLHGGQDHGGDDNDEDVAAPARTGLEVELRKALESNVVLRRELGNIVQMGDGVQPGEEEDRPRHELVEGDVLIELDDPV